MPFFFLVAWLLWREYQKTRTAPDQERITLIVLVTLTGWGAFSSIPCPPPEPVR
jgi:hypothetical protein